MASLDDSDITAVLSHWSGKENRTLAFKVWNDGFNWEAISNSLLEADNKPKRPAGFYAPDLCALKYEKLLAEHNLVQNAINDQPQLLYEALKAERIFELQNKNIPTRIQLLTKLMAMQNQLESGELNESALNIVVWNREDQDQAKKKKEDDIRQQMVYGEIEKLLKSISDKRELLLSSRQEEEKLDLTLENKSPECSQSNVEVEDEIVTAVNAIMNQEEPVEEMEIDSLDSTLLPPAIVDITSDANPGESLNINQEMYLTEFMDLPQIAESVESIQPSVKSPPLPSLISEPFETSQELSKTPQLFYTESEETVNELSNSSKPHSSSGSEPEERAQALIKSPQLPSTIGEHEETIQESVKSPQLSSFSASNENVPSNALQPPIEFGSISSGSETSQNVNKEKSKKRRKAYKRKRKAQKERPTSAASLLTTTIEEVKEEEEAENDKNMEEMEIETKQEQMPEEGDKLINHENIENMEEMEIETKQEQVPEQEDKLINHENIENNANMEEMIIDDAESEPPQAKALEEEQLINQDDIETIPSDAETKSLVFSASICSTSAANSDAEMIEAEKIIDQTPTMSASEKNTAMAIWKAISSHQYANDFKQKISFPIYDESIRRNLNLGLIKKRIVNNRLPPGEKPYVSIGEFKKEIHLMLTNAIVFNGNQSLITEYAKVLLEDLQVYFQDNAGMKTREKVSKSYTFGRKNRSKSLAAAASTLNDSEMISTEKSKSNQQEKLFEITDSARTVNIPESENRFVSNTMVDSNGAKSNVGPIGLAEAIKRNPRTTRANTPVKTIQRRKTIASSKLADVASNEIQSGSEMMPKTSEQIKKIKEEMASEAVFSTEKIVKRRGRPKKQTSLSTSSDVNSDSDLTHKPASIKEDVPMSEISNTLPTGISPKRGRGRPRKYPTTPPVAHDFVPLPLENPVQIERSSMEESEPHELAESLSTVNSKPLRGRGSRGRRGSREGISRGGGGANTRQRSSLDANDSQLFEAQIEEKESPPALPPSEAPAEPLMDNGPGMVNSTSRTLRSSTRKSTTKD